MKEKMLKKASIAALEKVFAAEDRLPFQAKAKIYRLLVDDGLLEEVSRVFGGRFRGGYGLPHAGRIAYCEQCRHRA